MAVLTWEKKHKVFLKVQEGTGDGLLKEDIAEGYTDYALWSTFIPDELEIDGELTMECLGSGMVLSKTPITALEALPQACIEADLDYSELIVLLEG